MAAIFVDLLGIAVTTASIASSYAGSQKNNHATFRVHAALNGPKEQAGTLTAAGGGAPDTRIFDEQLNFLGNTKDPTFALFTANDNAICISYISVTYPSNAEYSWVGNWGKQCGHPWYYADDFYDGKELGCTWIDANNDATDVTAFHVHWPDFNGDNPHSNNPSDYCNNVRTLNFQFGDDPGTIYTKRSAPEGIPTSKKRSSKTRDTRLVKSKIPGQSAVELCNSPTSYGPDFVSETEGMYCDMGSKRTMPLCPGNLLDLDALLGGCFDLGNLTTIVDQVVDEIKEFSDVIDWGEGSVS
ncbi:hypothetical protein KC356_g5217 [Hortaea werneckii]|nr:hypothetical protein KC356_g5217 [Hortaea werneckii]